MDRSGMDWKGMKGMDTVRMLASLIVGILFVLLMSVFFLITFEQRNDFCKELLDEQIEKNNKFFELMNNISIPFDQGICSCHCNNPMTEEPSKPIP